MRKHPVPLTLVLATTLHAQDPTPMPPAVADLAELSLEQLMEVPVEVSSRQSQPLSRTAAAVFVLNEPEIRRSGLRSVAELLRLVPGLVIAQDVPGAYSFSSRVGTYSTASMLVLIDGQRLYPTLLRREYWQAIDLPVEVIERIEVVRGPGGSRWGDKAAQGVINIVTKKAEAAAGARVTGVVGTEERLAGSFRFGGGLGEDTDFYLFGKSLQRDGGRPEQSGDRFDNNSVGFRVDSKLATDVALTFDGLWHDSFIGDNYIDPPRFASHNMIKGGHLKGRLRIDHDGDAWTEWRAGADTYDQDIRDYEEDVPGFHLRFREELFDTMLQHSRPLASGLRLTVGSVLRQQTVEEFRVVAGTGREFNETRGDVFAALDWDLTERLRLTLGGNFGYQDNRNGHGIDTQPDLRLAWTPADDLTVWTALSYSRDADQRYLDSGILTRQRAPSLVAYELGLRKRFGETLLLSVDTFAYEIDNQTNSYATDPPSGADLYLSDGRTNAFGGEIHATWKPSEDVRITCFLASTEANSRNFDENFFDDRDTIEGQVPRLRGGATLGFEPLPGLEFDSNILYTQGRAGVPAWWRIDLRLGWRASERTSIDLVGQNLNEPGHVEYWFDEQFERGVYLQVTHRF